MLDHLLLHVVPSRPTNDPEATDTAGVALAAVYEFRLDRWRIFGGGPADVKQLMGRLLPADLVSGYNLLHQDYPILLGAKRLAFRNGSMFKVLAGRTHDICQQICQSLNKDHDHFTEVSKAWSLDTVARGTLGVPQVGNGMEAGQHLALGDWPSAVSYALEDAGLIKQLVVFVERHGYVVHHSSGQRLQLRHASQRHPGADLDPLKRLMDQ